MLLPLYDDLIIRHEKDIRHYFDSLPKDPVPPLSWWISILSSRNPDANPFVRFLMRLLLFRDLVLRREIDGVVVNSYAEAEVLQTFLKRENRLEIKVYLKQKGRNKDYRPLFYHKIRGLAGGVFEIIKYFSIVWDELIKFRRWKKADHAIRQHVPEEEITLLETYIGPFSFRDGNYRDTYYQGIMDCLDENQKRNTFYLPTFYNLNDPGPALKGLKASRVNFIIRERLLSYRDFAKAACFPFQFKRLRLENPEFLGFDPGPVLQKEKRRAAYHRCSIQSTIHFCFFRQLKRKGYRLEKYIDWFENQWFDRSANLAVHTFFPNVKSIGYAGYAPGSMELNVRPHSSEVLVGVLPDVLGVIGHGFEDYFKEYAPELEVFTAPAFRFRYLFESIHEPIKTNSDFCISIALPYYEDQAMMLLLAIREIIDIFRGDERSIRFCIKLHPAVPVTRKLISEIEGMGAVLTEDPFEILIRQTNLLICTASSASMEALAMGVPVIEVAGLREGSSTNIPKKIPSEIHTICYNVRQTVNAILSFYSARNHDYSEVARTVRETYFCPVTKATVQNFIQGKSPQANQTEHPSSNETTRNKYPDSR